MANIVYTDLDLNFNQIKNVRLENLATAPSSPYEGQTYYNTTDHLNYIYNGTSWVAFITVTSLGAASGVATLNSSSLVVQDPANAVTVAAANKIVKADSSNKIDNAWLKTGSGNGIDADLLDGQHGAYYATAAHLHTGTYQPLDASLTSISGLAGTTGFLKKISAGTYSLDTSTFLTGNQTITISGDASGSGTTAITLTLAASGVTAATVNNSATAITPITVNTKGLITATGSAVTITPAFSSITSKPTTLSGYGITDAQSLIAAGTVSQYYRGDKTWATLDKTAVGLGNVENTALSTWAGSSNLVTAGALTAASLSVTGNLTVNGTTITVNSTTLTIADPIITLGGTSAPVSNDSKDRGIEFRWHNGTVAKLGFFGYDNSTGYLTFIPDATNTSEVFSGTQGDIQASNFRGTLIGSASSLTTGRTISITGDISYTSPSFDGSANITAAATLAASGVTAGTVNNSVTAITPLTIDTKGRVTSTGSAVTITPAFSSITGKPTTLAGYGITDGNRKYAATIGDGVSSSIVVTHNLNTTDVDFR